MPSTPADPSSDATVSRRGFLRASMVVGGGGLASGAAAAEYPPSIVPPRGPAVDVRAFGAIGDGAVDDTPALQHAIDAARALGGGTVVVPAGVWRSGTLHLRSHVTIELSPGAVLLASDDDTDFDPPEVPAFRTGSDAETIDFAHALLAAFDVEHVAVIGRGTIDMNRRRRFGPKPIAMKRCRFVTVRDVSIVHSPNYCVSLGGCDDVVVEGVTIRNGYADGIDPDCCRRVRIAGCDVECDDDALCLKASFLLGARAVTEEVVITNCRLRSPSNCFKLGTESTGDFREIVISNCVLNGRPIGDGDLPEAAEGGGIAILTVDGGTIDGVMVSNVVMRDVRVPLFVRLGNRGRDQTRPRAGRLRNVSISGVVAAGASGTGSIAGLPGHPVERITVDNVRIATTGSARPARGLEVPERPGVYPKVTMYGRLPAFGLYVRHARDVMLRDVELTVKRRDPRPALVADDVTGLHLAGFGGAPARPEAGPIAWLNNVQGGLVQGNVAPAGAGVFLRVTGGATRNVALVGNAYWTPGPIELGPEIQPTAVLQPAGAMASIGPAKPQAG